MTDCMCTNEPLTDIDARLDDLCRSLIEFRDLRGFVHVLEGIRTAATAAYDIDHPEATEALAVVNVFSALTSVAEELIKLQEGPR